MLKPVGIVCLTLSLAYAATATLPAQLTRQQIDAAHDKHAPIPPPSNLQVLPKDIAMLDLVETMVRMSEGLAVQCPYCHAFTPDHKDIDFKSDANPMKAKARSMLRMTNDINGKYLAELPGPHTGTAVGCGTCHQGNAVPPAYKPPSGFVLQ